MRISLLCNESAGDGVSLENLAMEIQRAGHELVQVVRKNSDLARVIEDSAELVVAAGGDGTVRRAATALAGRKKPLAILPLGTANNIARSLGIVGSVSQLIDTWSGARRLSIDLGIARASWGDSCFLEAMGGGLIPEGILLLQATPHQRADSDSRLAFAVRQFQEILSRLEPHRSRLTVDGVSMEGDFLLLEVLNIPSVGPNLVLSPDADPSDGFFSVVTAGETDREQLADYLRHRIEGRECRLALLTRRGRNIEIQGCNQIHVDDEVHRCASIGTVSAHIGPAALEVLV